MKSAKYLAAAIVVCFILWAWRQSNLDEEELQDTRQRMLIERSWKSGWDAAQAGRAKDSLTRQEIEDLEVDIAALP